jgi:hypothetical protein
MMRTGDIESHRITPEMQSLSGVCLRKLDCLLDGAVRNGRVSQGERVNGRGDWPADAACSRLGE